MRKVDLRKTSVIDLNTPAFCLITDSVVQCVVDHALIFNRLTCGHCGDYLAQCRRRHKTQLRVSLFYGTNMGTERDRVFNGPQHEVAKTHCQLSIQWILLCVFRSLGGHANCTDHTVGDFGVVVPPVNLISFTWSKNLLQICRKQIEINETPRNKDQTLLLYNSNWISEEVKCSQLVCRNLAIPQRKKNMNGNEDEEPVAKLELQSQV